jgi:hypothetical protein
MFREYCAHILCVNWVEFAPDFPPGVANTAGALGTAQSAAENAVPKGHLRQVTLGQSRERRGLVLTRFQKERIVP